MKAFLLAAGRGTRLRPITDAIPKCLVPINGKPLLYYWFALCRRYGISDVLINLHHFPEQVRQYASANDFGLNITLSYEETLLGSGGTIKANYNFIRDEDFFFILYSDNLTTANLAKLAAYHASHQAALTMGLFRTDRPEACGVAELNENGLVTSFVEKPENPRTNLANAGIYVAAPSILEYFPGHDFIDLGYDVLPRLIGKMNGYVIDEYLLDIGTLDNYRKAQSDIEQLDF